MPRTASAKRAAQTLLNAANQLSHWLVGKLEKSVDAFMEEIGKSAAEGAVVIWVGWSLLQSDFYRLVDLALRWLGIH